MSSSKSVSSNSPTRKRVTKSNGHHHHKRHSATPTPANDNAQYQRKSDNNQQQPQPSQHKVLLIMEQLISLLNLTIKTSTKVLTPALSNIISKTLPTVIQLAQQITPTRIQHWIHIIYISYANAFELLLHSPQGQTLIYNAQSIFEQYMNLITGVNARQIIIDSMTFNIKLINLFSSTEFKAVMSSFPILTIRVIDTLSSGEAKLFYHSLWNLFSSAIDFVNQEDMIVLFAEITARVVNALEMENVHYLPSRRKIQRRKRKVLITTTTNGTNSKLIAMKRRRKRKGIDQQLQQQIPSYRINVAALEAKRRQERNHFMRQTYNQRVLLRHNDHDIDNQITIEDYKSYGDELNIGPTAFHQDRQVEDAILSSLSPDLSIQYGDDDAWLTRLGRHDKYGDVDADNVGDKKVSDTDVPSLPSKVILKNNHYSGHENTHLSIDSSIHLDDLDVHSNENTDEDEDGYVDLVDTSYLRTGIEKSKLNDNNNNLSASYNKNDRQKSGANLDADADDDDLNDIKTSPKAREKCNTNIDIEDLVLDSVAPVDNDIHGADSVTKEKKQRNKIDLAIPHEEIHEDNFNDDKIENKKLSGRKKMNTNIHGEKATVAQFYRALDDIATTIKNQNISDALKATFAATDNINSSKKKKRAKWYSNAAAAVGAGNECGQDILRNWGMKPEIFSANIGVGNMHSSDDVNENITNPWKGIVQIILSQFTPKQKVVISLIMLVYAFICAVWFAFGCYGLYNWLFNGSPDFTSTPPPNNEFVIRIIQEGVTKQAVIESVVKAVGGTARAGESDFVNKIVASIKDGEL